MPASAQSYPSKPIHIVVPFAPGGITDILARALGQRLTDAWGQQVVIENKPGANSQIGAEYVAKAAPDGYTLLVSADTTFVMNPHLYSKLGYDPVKDFVPVSGLGISPQALVVHPSVPASTVAELIAYAKTKPGELNYGTFGPAPAAISTSSWLQIADRREVHRRALQGRGAGDHRSARRPYPDDDRQHRAGAPALRSPASSRCSASAARSVCRSFPTCRRSPRACRASRRPPGTASSRRTARRARSSTSSAPKRVKIFSDPAFRDKFLAPAMTFSIASSPDKFAERIHADLAKWGKVIKDAKVKLE